MVIELCPDGSRYARLTDRTEDPHAYWDAVSAVLESAAEPLTQRPI
jgi:hypothetical protein